MQFLITAGPTREPIDSVRFLSNRSSGRMGLALAQAATQAGHEVTLLLGPVGQDEAELRRQLPGAHIFRFESSAELKQLLDAHFRGCEVLIMAAAVADYRPRLVLEGKLPRDPSRPLTLELEPTPDLVALLAGQRRPGQRIVAFALEEAEHLEDRALAKMRKKGVDAIVANPLGTMEAKDITPLLLYADGRRATPSRMSKEDFARWLVGRISDL